MQLINNILHILDFLEGANTKVKPRWEISYGRVLLMMNLSFFLLQYRGSDQILPVMLQQKPDHCSCVKLKGH